MTADVVGVAPGEVVLAVGGSRGGGRGRRCEAVEVLLQLGLRLAVLDARAPQLVADEQQDQHPDGDQQLAQAGDDPAPVAGYRMARRSLPPRSFARRRGRRARRRRARRPGRCSGWARPACCCGPAPPAVRWRRCQGVAVVPGRAAVALATALASTALAAQRGPAAPPTGAPGTARRSDRRDRRAVPGRCRRRLSPAPRYVHPLAKGGHGASWRDRPPRRVGRCIRWSVPSRHSMDSAVRLRDAVAVLGQFPALAGATLAVPRGRSCSSRGRTGRARRRCCGCAPGCCPWRAGEAEVLGHDLRHDRASVRRRVGLLGHSNGLYAELTVRDNVRFWGKTIGATQQEVDAALVRLGLADRLADLPRRPAVGGTAPAHRPGLPRRPAGRAVAARRTARRPRRRWARRARPRAASRGRAPGRRCWSPPTSWSGPAPWPTGWSTVAGGQVVADQLVER